MSPARKTIAKFGPKGQQVRVLEDAAVDRVIVQWREQGKLRKHFFDRTAEGRKEAKAWAKGFASSRGKQAHVPVSLRQLWERYTEAEFPHLRPRSQVLYAQRWRKWELYWSATFKADDTTLGMVDTYRASERKIGTASNQVRNVLNVVRVVYNWGESREYLTVNKMALHRWKAAKDEIKIEPGEYRSAEWDRMVAVFNCQDATSWRAWAVLMLVGVHGMRMNAVRHLRWEDIQGDRIHWPAQYQKNGEPHEQPLTWEALSVLLTARHFAERRGYTGRWVIFGARHGQDEPYTYGAAWKALRDAERMVGVTHEPYRAFHGGRRMAAGNVADATGDERLGMEWIADRDMKMRRAYLKRRDERMDRAADAATGKLVEGVEPSAAGLRNQSSTTELHQHPKPSLDRPYDSVSGEMVVSFEPTTTSVNPPVENATYIEGTPPNPGEIPGSGTSPTAESSPEAVPRPSLPGVERGTGQP